MVFLREGLVAYDKEAVRAEVAEIPRWSRDYHFRASYGVAKHSVEDEQSNTSPNAFLTDGVRDKFSLCGREDIAHVLLNTSVLLRAQRATNLLLVALILSIFILIFTILQPESVRKVIEIFLGK